MSHGVWLSPWVAPSLWILADGNHVGFPSSSAIQNQSLEAWLNACATSMWHTSAPQASIAIVALGLTGGIAAAFGSCLGNSLHCSTGLFHDLLGFCLCLALGLGSLALGLVLGQELLESSILKVLQLAMALVLCRSYYKSGKLLQAHAQIADKACPEQLLQPGLWKLILGSCLGLLVGSIPDGQRLVSLAWQLCASFMATGAWPRQCWLHGSGCRCRHGLHECDLGLCSRWLPLLQNLEQAVLDRICSASLGASPFQLLIGLPQ